MNHSITLFCWQRLLHKVHAAMVSSPHSSSLPSTKEILQYLENFLSRSPCMDQQWNQQPSGSLAIVLGQLCSALAPEFHQERPVCRLISGQPAPPTTHSRHGKQQQPAACCLSFCQSSLISTIVNVAILSLSVNHDNTRSAARRETVLKIQYLL